ncbi:MAG: hypothetical protein LBL61_04620, partial [Elusimicrobiota bacterium]|nr:hypothetical protein [Elusimicrobiota bacterium]
MKNKKFLSMDTVSVYNLTSDFFLRFVLYIFLFIFLYPAFTAPLHAAGNSYGHEYDLEKDFRTGAEHSYYNYNDKASPYLIYKVVSGEPIRYCLHIGERELKKLSYNDLSTQVLFAHNAWTQGIYDIIGNAGRDKEFDDFSSITPSVIKNAAYGFEGSEKIIRHTDEDSGKCDLFIIYDIAYCFHGYDGSPSYFTAEPMPQICLSPGRDSFNISTDFSSEELISKRKEINNIMAKNTERYYFVSELEHEMGHAFGLGDQYEKGLRNNDLAYSTVPVLRYSLMKSDSPVLTCDDADGFISLYYRIKKQDKTFQSLCNDGVTIENGKPLRNKNEWIFVSDIFYSGNVYTIGKSGKYVKHPAREIELISSDAKRVEQDKRMLDH